MHKVRNIRDIAYIEGQPIGERWRSYCSDLDKLFDRAIEGGFGNFHSNSNSYGRSAA